MHPKSTLKHHNMNNNKTLSYDISPERYNKILSGIQLLSIDLMSISAERAEDWTDIADPCLQHFENHSYKQIDRNNIIVKSGYSISIIDKDNPEMIACTVKMVLRSKIFTKDKFTKAFFQVFSQLNLPVNVWPYVRTYTQFLTANMGLPSVTLPYRKNI